MRTLWLILILFLLLLANCTSATQSPTQENLPTLITAMQSDGRFDTFLGLIDSAALTETLTSDGSYTIFAPTDHALADLDVNTMMLDPGTPSAFVSRYITTTVIPPANLEAHSPLVMQNGESIILTSDTFGGLPFDSPPIETSNGVIYPLNTVIETLP